MNLGVCNEDCLVVSCFCSSSSGTIVLLALDYLCFGMDTYLGLVLKTVKIFSMVMHMLVFWSNVGHFSH